MSVLKSMYAAASGLLAHSEAISVASDNIANVNTVGFKTQRARFEDVLGSTVAGAVENQASGQGVRLGGVHSLFTQGSLIASRLNTDMAIQGDGFFVLRGGYDGLQDGKFFTRQGQFNIDNEGYLTNYKGLRVQGYTADQNERLKSTLSDLEVPLTQIVPPKESTAVSMGANLQPNGSEDFIVNEPSTSVLFGTGGNLPPQNSADYVAGGFDVTTLVEQVANTATDTFHYSQTVTVYDNAEGEEGPQAHQATIYFTQKSATEWDWNAVVGADEMEASSLTTTNSDVAVAGVMDVDAKHAIIAGGSLTFTASGELDTTANLTQSGGTTDQTGKNNFLFSNTQSAQVIDFNYASSNIKQDSGSFGITPTADGSLGFQSGDPETTSHFSTSVTLYDTLGVGHNVNVFFNQTATGEWEWHALADGAELTDENDATLTRAGENVVLADGVVTFDNNGRLMTESQTDKTFHFFNTDGTQLVKFDLGDNATAEADGGDGGTGLSGLTQFDSPSSVSAITQDGYASGSLAGIKVGLDGKIRGTFTNGERRILAAVALARFVNNDGLIRRDAGHYTESPDSGQALIGQAGTGGRGSIIGNNLEQSTVELANEFVSVISYQRGFQANSRSITTADQLLQEAVNLKR